MNDKPAVPAFARLVCFRRRLVKRRRQPDPSVFLDRQPKRFLEVPLGVIEGVAAKDDAGKVFDKGIQSVGSPPARFPI